MNTQEAIRAAATEADKSAAANWLSIEGRAKDPAFDVEDFINTQCVFSDAVLSLRDQLDLTNQELAEILAGE